MCAIWSHHLWFVGNSTKLPGKGVTDVQIYTLRQLPGCGSILMLSNISTFGKLARNSVWRWTCRRRISIPVHAHLLSPSFICSVKGGQSGGYLHYVFIKVPPTEEPCHINPNLGPICLSLVPVNRRWLTQRDGALLHYLRPHSAAEP